MNALDAARHIEQNDRPSISYKKQDCILSKGN